MSKREVSIPQVDPRLTNASAARYAASLAARKANPPVGGGPLPPIPNLTRDPPTDGVPMSMSAHAVRERANFAATNVASLLENPDTIFGGAQPRQQPTNPMGPPPGLMQLDTLPDAAKQDPNYHEGAGSGYAVNQPHLAMKYGVIRQGNHIPPQALAPAREQARTLSDKTIKGLEDVARFQRMREQEEAHNGHSPDKDAEQGPAANAARLGNAPGDKNTAPITPEERKELAETAVRKMDDFDFDTFRQLMMKDLLNNPEQRDIIEERVKPMDLADLIIETSVAQEVMIIPGKFWVVFRSVGADEDLAVKRLLMEEAKAIQIDDRYYLDKFAIMTLALGLESICGNPVPSHRVKGRFDEEAFWKKYDYVARLNIHMCASLGLNFFWFDVRVRKLFVAEKIKNG